MKTLSRIVFLALVALPYFAFGQTYPSQPIRLIVPYAAGGAVDALCRPLAQKITELTGQPVIVDNRPGANATLGTDIVAKSTPDGYTVVMTSINHYLVPFFSKNVPYDAMRDFTPVINVVMVPNILAVHPSLPVNSISELIEYAKKNPSKLFFGTTGIGSTHQLGGIMLAQMASINLEHVPYKGGSPTINDLLAGALPMAILTATTILPHARQGRLRALAVIEAKRARAAPELPTVGETVSGYAVPDTWLGVLGPAKMPRAAAESLNAIIRKALGAPEVKVRLENLGFDITGNTLDEFAAAVRSDAEVIKRILTTAGIKPD